jgi:hypothetical protein
MLERAHRLGPLKLAAIVAALLAVTGAVVWALSRDGGSESTPEAARNPVQSESAETPPSTIDAGTNDAGADGSDDPNPKNRGGNGAPRASDSGGQNGQEPEPSRKKEPPAKAAKPPQGGSDDGDEASSDQPPRNLPPELERLLGGIAEGE